MSLLGTRAQNWNFRVCMSCMQRQVKYDWISTSKPHSNKRLIFLQAHNDLWSGVTCSRILWVAQCHLGKSNTEPKLFQISSRHLCRHFLMFESLRRHIKTREDAKSPKEPTVMVPSLRIQIFRISTRILQSGEESWKAALTWKNYFASMMINTIKEVVLNCLQI